MKFGVRGRAALILSSMLLAGCVSYAKTPAGATFGKDYAAAEFRLGVDETVGLGSATVQEYRISETASYDDGQTVKIFTWAAKEPKTHLMEVGKNTYIFAQMRDIGTSVDHFCTAGSSFTPQADTRYDVYLSRTNPGCLLEIKERESGNDPADLERVRYPAPEQ